MAKSWKSGFGAREWEIDDFSNWFNEKMKGLRALVKSWKSGSGAHASRIYYFSKDVSDLSLVESSLLVGLLPAPAIYSPVKYPERAERRSSEDDDAESGTPEEELYRQFAELSAAKANGEIDDETFEAKKEEIWEQLGIELQ